MAQVTKQNAIEDKSLEEERSSLIRKESLPSPCGNVDPSAKEELTQDQNINNINPRPTGKTKCQILWKN